MINDITDKDIAELNDEDLRELIGKLCEATLNKNNIDPICVTYGGNQDEPDGGVDVRIKATDIFNDNWAIPRNNTIFQVKKPTMPKSSIQKEMMNKDGRVKDSIKELVKLNGAYIIACSGDSLSDKRKNERITCMRDLLHSIDKKQNIKVDFYDSKRIATWVKQFPSIIIWVNEKIGKRTIGWNSYYNWSNPNEEEKEFIIDEGVFLHKDNFYKENERTIVEGINEIRELLSKERKVVRLAGLSGVGKTRFAQALFDKNIGEKALFKEKVIYCDIGNEPNPVPITFIQELIALQQRVIVVIDNCDKELHNKLAEFVGNVSSKLSMLTIEYDVKEDLSIESYNYYLDTSLDNTIRKLIKRDFDYIDDSNIETIVKCSDGNFRIARYLAKTIDKDESIGTLRSEEMFKRLFFQNNKENQDLLDVGRICSIFISFNIELNKDDYNNELNILGRIIGKSPVELIRYANELNKRQIVQKRGNMRAVLPHAISNRLADELLSTFPEEVVINEIKNSKRLELSFFRRLRFLHNKEYAINIASLYLDNIDFENIDKHEMEILNCIKVISPEKILYKIEQVKKDNFFTRKNDQYYDWARILAYIAYDPEFFYRATRLLIEFAKTEKKNENYNSIRDILYKLFHVMLSGTHALIDERIKVVDSLINDQCKIKNDIAIKLIDELLKTGGFLGQIIDESTSRKRDYGYWPRTNKEYKEWYASVFKYCEELMKKNIFMEEIKEVLSNNFRDLASQGFYNELEKIVENVLLNETWPQIWISIGVIKHFDRKKVPQEMLERMNKLQEKCSPKTIDDKIKVFLNNGRRIYWELEDITENEEKIYNTVKELGNDIGADKEHFKENLLKLNNDCSLHRMGDLAKGLFENIDNDCKLIYFLLDNMKDNNRETYLEIISNYLALMNEKNSNSDKILDEILQNKKYNKYYPKIQFGYQLKQSDVERVKKSLAMKVAQIEDYSRIEFTLANTGISDIIEILELFPKCNSSENIIICILHNLYWNQRKDKILDEYSRSFIVSLDYTNRDDLNDHCNYELGQVVEYCFDSKDSKNKAIQIFDKFMQLIDKKGISYYGYSYILKPLIKLYPTEFLDKLFSIENIDQNKISYFVEGFCYYENIINIIDEDLLIQWVENNKKAKEISAIIDPIEKINDIYKWKKISRYFFENYIENEEILNNLMRGIYPTSWSDKYSSVLETRISLARELEEYKDDKIKKIGSLLEKSLREEIYRRQKDEEKEQERYNTFE